MSTTEQSSQSKPAVLCSFYTKIGSCRHGEECSKKHLKPTITKTILLPNLYQNPRFDLVEYLSRNRKQHRVKKRKTGDKNSDDIAEINFETKDGVKDNEEKANVDGENKEHDQTKEIESEDVISKDKEEVIVDRSGIAQQDKQKESNKEGKQEGESEKEEPNKKSTEEELPPQGVTQEVPNHNQEESPIKQEQTAVKQEKHGLDENHPVLTDEQIQKDFDLFYQDIFVHVAKLGQINDMAVCENENHLSGHVYIKFNDYNDAIAANLQLNQEWYNGKPVYSELSPVNILADAHCKSWDHGHCDRGAKCNYLHVKQPTQGIKKSLWDSQTKTYTLKKLEMLKKEVPEEIMSGASSDNGNKVNTKDIEIRSTMALLELMF